MDQYIGGWLEWTSGTHGTVGVLHSDPRAGNDDILLPLLLDLCSPFMSSAFSPQPAIYRNYEEDGTKQPANLHVPSTGIGLDPSDPYLSAIGRNSSQLDIEAGANTHHQSSLGHIFSKGWKNFASRFGVSRSVEEEANDAPRSVISGPSPLTQFASVPPSPYMHATPARTASSPGTETTDDALEGTTAVGHHETPYFPQHQRIPPPPPAFSKPIFAPYTSPDAITIQPAAAPDYAKMGSSQSSISSLGSYLHRLKVMFRELNDLPWIADRCTVDYVPPPKQQFRERTHHRAVPSWYNHDPNQRVDLFAGESPMPPPVMIMKQVPPPAPEAAMYGPGIMQMHTPGYAKAIPPPPSASQTPAPRTPAPQTLASEPTATPYIHHSPMPVYGYSVAPPEPDADIYSGFTPGYATSGQSRVHTPADGMFNHSHSQSHSASAITHSSSEGSSSYSSREGSRKMGPGSPTMIYAAGVHSPQTNYPYPVFSPSQ